ncbi:hypothetical protein F5Y18DRAFT_35105 [Xylariaceae sp. FL1019]|nr:hypothetical protein F5Y18DRAFT_35105 [Xylariaceae sp. FL1019]
MSVFSIIKRGRAQAKEQKSKQVEKKQDEAVKLPYKHVVTHAAIDALATAPSSWKSDDRPKIREQNARRSARASNGMSSSGLPRVGSNLSNVSYPSVYGASPIPALPKNYSYSSIPTAWRDKMAMTPEGVESPDYFGRPSSFKGKEREPMPRFTIGTTPSVLSSGRTSPLSSRDVPLSNEEESGRMSISISGVQDEKEMRNQASNFSHNIDTRPSSYHSRNRPPSSESCHRLHPAHARRNSENVVQPERSQPDRHYPPAAKSTYFTAPRPSNRRVYNADTSDVPHIPTLPDHLGTGAASSSSALSLVSIGVAVSTPSSSVISTPTPSAAGDPPPNMKPPRTQPVASMRASPLRRFSFGSRRSSIDTVTPEPVDYSSGPLPASSARRRLSKQKPSSSTSQFAEREQSWHADPEPYPQGQATPVDTTETLRSRFKLPTPTSRSVSRQWNNAPGPTATAEVPRRKLSKDQPRPSDNENSKKSRWSWSRRSSMTSR